MMSNKNYYLVLGISVIIYLVAAFNSVGYHQEDEHYQIIGFAEYKAGRTNDVAWEFRRQIRSCLQPLICMGIFSTARSIGINSPFTLALILRLLTAGLAIFIIQLFSKEFVKNLKPNLQIWFIGVSFLLWFLPYINVRFSSETWSGLFGLLTLYFLKKHDKDGKWIYRTGIALSAGLAIIFRFQALFCVIGLLAWCLFIGKYKSQQLMQMIVVIIIILLLGVTIDSWFYSKFTFALYNYFQVNVQEDVASVFGRYPWYKIIVYLIQGPILPIGFMLIAALIIVMIKEPSSIYLWYLLPFIIAHSLSPHKEIRFFFPLANLAPAVFFLAFSYVKEKFQKEKYIFRYFLIATLFVVNLFGLAIVSYISPRKGETEIAAYIDRHFENRKVNLICTYESDPFEPYMHLSRHFYQAPLITVTMIPTFWDRSFANSFEKGQINLVVITKSEHTGELTAQRLAGHHMHLVKDTLPGLFAYLVSLYDSEITVNRLLLYEYQP